MENFDQFIRNLGESETPEYKERYWKRFARKAGFKVYNTTKIVVGCAATALIVGAAFWVGIHFSKSIDSPEIMLENPIVPERPIMPSDTMTIEDHQDTIGENVNVMEDVIETPVIPVASSKQERKPADMRNLSKENRNVEVPQDKPIPLLPATEQPKKERQIESFYFDADTIGK